MESTQSRNDGRLTQAAFDLVAALNRVADDNLPGKLAGMVKLHAGIAVGCIFVPVPGAGLLAAAGNTWTMYARINKELGLPFAENLVRSLATGVLTNLASNAAILAVFGLGAALKFLPGPGTIASYAVLSATVYGVTIAAGYVYMKALTTLLTKKNVEQVDENDLKSVVVEILDDDKEAIDSIFKSAKEEYKSSDSNLDDLAEELGKLKQTMQKNATTSEQEDAAEEIAAAEMAAQRNDTSRTFKRLKKAGQWALESADTLELNIASASLRTALGL